MSPRPPIGLTAKPLQRLNTSGGVLKDGIKSTFLYSLRLGLESQYFDNASCFVDLPEPTVTNLFEELN